MEIFSEKHVQTARVLINDAVEEVVVVGDRFYLLDRRQLILALLEEPERIVKVDDNNNITSVT